MAVALIRGIQPLQQCVYPMWEYNRINDLTRTLRGEFHNRQTLVKMLASMFKGEEVDFLREPLRDGFSTHKPVCVVSFNN